MYNKFNDIYLQQDLSTFRQLICHFQDQMLNDP